MELEVWAVRVREKKYRVMNSRGSCNMVDINGAIIVWNGRGEKRENRIFFRLGKRGMKWTLRGDLLSGTYPSYTVFERCYLYRIEIGRGCEIRVSISPKDLSVFCFITILRFVSLSRFSLLLISFQLLPTQSVWSD